MHAKDLYDRLAAGYNYDPMYGELCTERDRLKKENAKLREQSERLFDKTLELATENSKLRELVLVMWDVALHPQLFGDGSYLLGRMRALGIEVE